MKMHRRNFLKAAGLTLGAVGFIDRDGFAAESPQPASFIRKPSQMKLGTVTYNIAKDWDIPTIIKNCTETKFQGVELRTSHAHGVEVALIKPQRKEVRKLFHD